MKKVISLIFGLVFSTVVPAQVTVIESAPLSTDSSSLPAKKRETALPSFKKWDYGVQLGTSASFSKGYGSGFSTFISPHVTWRPSQRFRVNAGISIVNTSLFGYQPSYYGFESGSPFSGNYTHALLYVEGQYLLTKNLQLSGALYADVPLTGSDPANPYSTSNLKGFSMDLQYRIGTNATIQAGFNYIRSEGPWYYDPFRPAGSMYYDPFRSSFSNPFNR
jgi:hypothetical protein